MSRPFQFPARKKEEQIFNDFIADNQLSLIDLHRTVGQFKFVTAPSSSTDTGSFGMVSIDDDYLYVCTSSNTWKRVALTTW